MMGFVTVHREPKYQIFQASPTSLAAVLQIVLYLVTFGAPIVLVALNPDAWPLSTFLYEQPLIRYKQVTILNLDLSDGTSLVWSTIPVYNRLQGNSYRPSVLKMKEIDEDGDRVPEQILLSIDTPLKLHEHVVAFTVMGFLDYVLQVRRTVEVASMLSIQHSAGRAGAAIFADGSLRLMQSRPFPLDLSEMSLKEPLLDLFSSDPDDYSIRTLIKRVAERNASTVLDLSSPLWTSTAAPPSSFHIDITIRCPVNAVWFETSLLHRLSVAGSFYVFWLLPFWLAARILRHLLYSSGIIPTVKNPEKYTMKMHVVPS